MSDAPWDERKPRVFYYEEGLHAWVPVPDDTKNLIPADNFDEHGEVIELRFKRVDLSDKEMEALPDL